MKENPKGKHVLAGMIGSIALFSFYLAILTFSESFEHATQQFFEMWYWITALVVGFGIQVGLYSFIRAALKAKRSGNATKSVAAAGGMSGTSMVLCCLHHVTDVLPIIGLSAAALFLVQYQASFLLLGVLSNAVGVLIMLEVIQKHGFSQGTLKNLLSVNISPLKKTAIVFSVGIVGVSFFFSGVSTPDLGAENTLGQTNSNEIKKLDLQTKSNNENGITIEVTPVDFEFGKEVRFEMKLNTHVGSQDFDLTEVAVLKDNKGNTYYPLEWEGSPPGGHHRSGVLAFPSLKDNADSMKLVLKDIYGVPERSFTWKLA